MNAFTRLRYSLDKLPIHLVLIALVLFTICPLVVLTFNSFKTTAEIGLNGLTPPQTLHWDNFSRAWEVGNYSTNIQNSLILTVGAALGVMVIGSLAGYSLAKLRPVGLTFISILLLVFMVIPKILYIAPLFILWKHLGLVNNRFGLIIIYWGLWSPFATFLLRSYFVSIPSELIDAARIDGASELKTFLKVIIPIAWPGILTVGLIISIWAWNEFLFSVTFLNTAELKTIAISLYGFIIKWTKDWELINAAAIMMTIPPLLLFLFFQRTFINGLTQGSVKG
jgi:raffinose/stachyose/melibiose transport system permease protein